MSKLTYRERLAVLVAMAMPLVGCAGMTDEAARTTSTPVRHSAPHPPTVGSLTNAPTGPRSIVERCGGSGRPGQETMLRAGRSTMPAVVLGAGPTWAVMVHQTDGDGLCGWLPFARWLVGREHVHLLLVDLCGYGGSRCRDAAFSADQVGQVVLAVGFARVHGARRVTVVGASMGGALATEAAARTSADAVVDLSGPPDWRGTNLVRVAPKLTMPALLAISPVDAEEIPTFRRAFEMIPATPKRLVVAKYGHGYELLGFGSYWRPFASLVGQWITGAYPRAHHGRAHTPS